MGEDRLVSYREMSEISGLSQQTLRSYKVQDSSFPRPVSDERRNKQFRLSEFNEWRQSREDRFALRRESGAAGRPPRLRPSAAAEEKTEPAGVGEEPVQDE